MKETKTSAPEVKFDKTRIFPDSSRVVTRPLIPLSVPRIKRILARIAGLDNIEAEKLYQRISDEFSHRHKNIQNVFEHNFNKIKQHIPAGIVLNKTREAIAGAYFTMEYSIEASALFNPSIVLHPDQNGVDRGSSRFIMSMRATGEGHISSIEFRTGILSAENNIKYDPIGKYVKTQNVHVNPVYETYLFKVKLKDMDVHNDIARYIMDDLPPEFTYNELKEKINALMAAPVFPPARQNKTFELMFWLANSNYSMDFDPDSLLSERIIFPVSRNESCGIEDARFVKFADDNGKITYYATYTAYNGSTILPQLIETVNFNEFKVITFNGDAVQNKGMALFPRKIRGMYVMLSRQDGENNRIMYSDNIHFWQKSEIIQRPVMPWEYIQIGNCGSPVETAKGWLVLTHGVGPMRQYSIGAILLDLENPAKVIGRLKKPLLRPMEKEREGYVPNVVYSCGSLIHNNELVIPYAMSDTMSGVAKVNLNEIFESMGVRRC